MANHGLFSSLTIFAVWMLASFLCHKLAKTATGLYEGASTPTSIQVAPLVVTFVQVICCQASIKLTTRSQRSVLFYVTAVSHVLATLATNVSLSLTLASSTMAIKMLEPVTSAILQSWLLKTPVGGVGSVAAMGIAVAGAVLYVGDSLYDSRTCRAVLLAVFSNLILGLRNVALKHSHNSTSGAPACQLKPTGAVLTFFVGTNVVILVVGWWETKTGGGGIVHTTFAPFFLLSLASGAFHVIYSYVSTNVVLRYMSVVSHALANILKRVLVVLLLHVSGRRTATPLNWAGLVVCTAGMLIYSRKKIFKFTQTVTSASESHELDRGAKEQNSMLESPETTKGKEKQLLRLLVPIAIIFILCMMPVNITGVQHLKFARGVNVTPQNRLRKSNTQTDFSQRSDKDSGSNSGYERHNRTVLVSPVLKSNPRHLGKSSADYARNLRFGYTNWTDGKPLINSRIPFQPDRKSREEIDEFLSRKHLIDTPFDTDGLSPYLTTAREVIDENKRIQFNLFRDLLKGKRYAVLFELASFENKGDSAITLGELTILENLGVKLLTYVNVRKCTSGSIEAAINVAKKYPKDEVVMLFHGGGNLIATSNVDRCRKHSLRLSRGYQQVAFPNSFWLRDTRPMFQMSRQLFCCNSNLTLLLRDRLSLKIAQRIFNGGTRLILSPDIAMHLGYVGRHIAPFHDVIWQKRGDEENAIFDKVPTFPSNVSLFVWDWMHMSSIPSMQSVREAVSVVQNGFGILQRGRVLVTDRLHGHILSTLLDIPHVLLDNADQKLSAFHNTWTRGIRNCRLTDNAEDAARLALELLEEYKDTVPKVLRAANLKEP